MRRLIVLTCVCFFCLSMNTDSIYSYSVTKINGTNFSISNLQGSKILIVVMPIIRTPAADSMLVSLDSLSQLYNSSLKIIGTPSIEDGFTDSTKNNLIEWYNDFLGEDIIITQGLMVYKNVSGLSQHPLYSWLTNADKNGRTDNDVQGPGTKFLINENGNIIGYLSPAVHLNSNALRKLITTNQ